MISYVRAYFIYRHCFKRIPSRMVYRYFLLMACVVVAATLTENDVCVSVRANNCENRSTACVKRGRNTYQFAVCLPFKGGYNFGSSINYCWKFCDLKSPNVHCKCDVDDENNLSKTTLPDMCFRSPGDCSWYDECLKATFPCLEQDDTYKFIKTLCTTLQNQKNGFKNSERREMTNMHKCVQERYFVYFTQPKTYDQDCNELSSMLDRYIGFCLDISAQNIQRFGQRQYVFWVMKDLLEQTKFANATRKVFERVFEQPSKDIVPNVVFMITTSVMCVASVHGYVHCNTHISDTTVDEWTNQIAEVLQWDERKVLRSCSYSFEKMEERRKRSLSGVYYILHYTKVECLTGQSQSSEHDAEYALQREILNGIDKNFQGKSSVTLSSSTTLTHAYVSFSGLTWCCYYQVGCLKTTIPMGFLFRNENDKSPRSPKDVGASFTLYTKGASQPDEQIIDVFARNGGLGNCLSSNRRVYFIIHGFRSSGKDEWVLKMVEAILQKEDSYLVAVDWEKGAAGLLNYNQAAMNTVTVGTLTAHTVSLLVAAGCTRPELVHIIGHSLGAQTAGFASLNGNIGRITGLDPAGPFFETKDMNSRLDRNDALFVDIIHTDGRVEEYLWKGLGLFFPTGHVDFYPNGGAKQPGCGVFGITEACSHSRSHQLFLDSVTSDCFTAQRCPTSHDCLHGANLESETAIMGFRTSTNSRGYFYLTTNSEAPFCVNTG